MKENEKVDNEDPPKDKVDTADNGDGLDLEDPEQWEDIIIALKDILGEEDDHIIDVTDFNAFVFLGLRANYIDEHLAALMLNFFGNLADQNGPEITLKQLHDEIKSLFDDDDD